MRDFNFHLIEQWSQFLHDCNWYTFDFILLEMENEEVLGGFEVVVIIMGFGFRWRWNYMETELTRELDETIKRIEDEEFIRSLKDD